MKRSTFVRNTALSLCLGLIFSISSVSASAMDVPPLTNNLSTNIVDYDIANEDLYSYALSLGYSVDEINFILTESKKIASNNDDSWTFPPNPEVGDTHTRTFFVSESTIISFGTTASSIALGLVKEGIGLTIALLLGETLANLIADNTAFEGVELTTVYVYGPTNDGGLDDWNTGPTTWEIIYS